MAQLDEKTLGKRLQEMRRKQGFTQQALCQAANLSYSTLAKIERGAIKSPSIFTVQSIAVAIGVSLDELMGMPTTGGSHLRRSKGGITFVYFDLNDTLVRATQRAIISLAEQTNVLPDVIESTFWHYNDALCRGKMTLSEFNEALEKRLGFSVDWAKAYLEGAEPIEAMRELLTWASQHYRVGIFSDTLPGLIPGLLERGILPEIPYAEIIDSSEVGMLKSDPQAFQMAQDRAGVPADEILLIDDSRGNILGAERQGWHVALFDGYRAEDTVSRVRMTLEPEA